MSKTKRNTLPKQVFVTKTWGFLDIHQALRSAIGDAESPNKVGLYRLVCQGVPTVTLDCPCKKSKKK